MKRWAIWRLGAAALGVSQLVVPSLAHADVMEIGTDGHIWIVGEGVAPGIVTFAMASHDVFTSSYTVVSADAGPQRWRASVGYLGAKYDVSPSLIEAMVWQESRWQVHARSPVGARGLAQLMPGTARELGVDPDDPAANLEGGVRYLRQQLDRFDGDVEKALAAYNAGPGRVRRAGGVPRIRETQNYVATIMARLSQPVRR